MPTAKPKLSVVITTWNEAKNLPRSVGSVKNIADEIIVVDTESTDNTVAVAKKLGCKVFSHPNTQIVEPVRNYSIQQASGDWILLLDADEEVSDTLAQEIKQLISENKVDYCRIPRQNILFNKWIKSSHWWPDYVYRLFRKGCIVWDSKIHSIPQTRGIGFDFPVSSKTSLIHHNYQSIGQYLFRMDRYTNIQAEELGKRQENFHWTQLISKPVSEFLNQYFAREGYKEGIHGLVLSLLQSYSELVVYLKLWEKTGFQEDKISHKEFQLQINKSITDEKWWIYESRIKNESNILKKSLLKIKRKI